MKIRITDHGSVWSFTALDDAARDFLHSVGAEGWQFMGDRTLVIDHRAAQLFVEQAADDGVEFEGAA